MGARKVLVLGDSILKPILINEENRYAISKSVNWTGLEKTLNVEIENKSKMGATIRHGLKLLNENIAMDKYFSVVIEFGGNDCSYDWAQVSQNKDVHLPKISPEEYEQTLREMISIVRQNNAKPILTTLPPISAKRYYDWFLKELNQENIMHHLQDVEVIYRHQEGYSNINQTVAAETQTEIVDIRKEFLLRKDFLTLICTDGSHPNAEGEQLIIEAFIKKYKQ